MTAAPVVVPGSARALKPGGRGNVAQIAAAIAASLAAAGYPTVASPWYFPSLGEYASLLEQHELEPTYAALTDRPTPLHDPEAGLQNWLRMFANPYFAGPEASVAQPFSQPTLAQTRPRPR